MKARNAFVLMGATLLASGCTTVPVGPSVAVLPGAGMTFDQFRVDDFTCRQFADQSVGQSAAKSASEPPSATKYRLWVPSLATLYWEKM